MGYNWCDSDEISFYESLIDNDYLEKEAEKDMPDFEDQDRPEKTKEIYKALKRDHPNMPAEMKARIAARQGKPGKQKQGPPYEGEIDSEYSEEGKEKDKALVENTSKEEREEMSKKAASIDFDMEDAFNYQLEKEAGLSDIWKSVKGLASKVFGKSTPKISRKGAFGLGAAGGLGVGVGIGMKIRSNRDIVPHFRTLPMNERSAIIAKARAISGDVTAPSSERRKAKALLKILEGVA